MARSVYAINKGIDYYYFTIDYSNDFFFLLLP